MSNKGGADPKYLNIENEPKKQVSFRLPITLNNKVQNLAKITNKTYTETLETILNNFLHNKIVSNDYLDVLESELYIKIPEHYYLKENIKTPKRYLDLRGDGEDLEPNELIDSNELINISQNDNLFYSKLVEDLGKGEILKIGNLFSIGTETTAKTQQELLNTIKNYEILLIPNNLDAFNYNALTYETIFNNGYRGHTGIDFLIIPDLAQYTDDLTNTLYIFYFKYFETAIRPHLQVFLINYIDALDIIGNKNENLKNLLKTIYLELDKAQSQDKVKEIANIYNTGNIIKMTDKETPKPDLINIRNSYNNNVSLYSYETLNNKLEALEKENQELKEKIDNLEDEFMKKLTQVLDQYK